MQQKIEKSNEQQKEWDAITLFEIFLSKENNKSTIWEVEIKIDIEY
jgi:hypothetical protein